MRTLLALIACGLAVSAPAMAQTWTPRAQYRVLGAGTIKCADWTKEARSAAVRANDEGWVLGFVSAFNRYGPQEGGNVMGQATNRSVLDWVDTYCRENPTHTVDNAAGALLVALKSKAAPAP